jgi:TonB-dependent SusC/RagA subfamily outer membrane receptor
MVSRVTFLAACLFVGGVSLTAQTRVVAGRVTDLSSGVPVTNGTVSVKGADIVDRLRPDGVFVLHVPRRDVTLVLRGDGYRVREITVRVGQDVALVELEPYTVQLDPLVVAGQGSRHPRNRPVSTGRLSSEQLDHAPSASLKQALQGKVSGVEVQQNSGLPGGDLQLRLRGVTTILGSSSPLYILDGVIVSDAAIPAGTAGVIGGQEPVPGRLMDLNLLDVESIELLKGAAATALYGSRGSNGVVVVTTKRGGTD